MAWFTPDGKLSDALSFSAKEAKDWSQQTFEGDIGLEYYWLLHECGFA